MSTVNSCSCSCHVHSISGAFCMMCAANHSGLFTAQQPTTDYSAMTFAVLQEIRDVLKDIKSALVEMNDDSKRRRRSQPGSSN